MASATIAHWLDRFVAEVIKSKKENFVISGGMAPSGPIHIGKIRGEVIYPSAIARELKREGKNVNHIVIIYTQDPLKAKERLVNRNFIEEWRGVRILNVPDPWNCHDNWVEHFIEPYYEVADEYGITARPIMTHEVYTNPKMKEAVKLFIKRRKEARAILNKYKGGKLEYGWFPARPVCSKCYNVVNTKVLSWIPDKELIKYACPRCGYEGYASLDNVKLEWRSEWTALWYTFDVDIELYGKDHAAAGGSRESCSELYRKLFNRQPPMGFPFEWVSLNIRGRDMEMSSSGGIAFTVDEWLRIGRAEALKYWYFVMRPMTHLEFDPSITPIALHDEYDRAERIYFGLEEAKIKDKEIDIKRAYELANDNNPPERPPQQVPYIFLAVIAQITPKGPGRIREAILKLKRTGHIKRELENWEMKIIGDLLEKAGYWAEKYAPEKYKLKIPKMISPEIIINLSDIEIEFIKKFINLLKRWNINDYVKLEAEIYTLIRNSGLSSKKGFRVLYKVLFGRESGPRLAPFLLSLGLDKAINIFESRLNIIERD